MYGDAYNSRERELERTLGPAAGRLHLGRTRREAGRIAFRLVLRDKLLGLHADVAVFAAAGGPPPRHAATLWADTTYLQPAQPSTFGHYLGGFAEQALRHLDRIEAAYAGRTCRPRARAGPGGTRLPMDRDRLARRLGFGAVGPHTRDAMWSADALADAVAAAAQTVATISQLAGDLEIFASPAFGYLTLDASLCRASVLMPQKRNPYALPVLRGGAGTLIGRLTGLLATGLTPSARTDNWLYAYGEVAGALDLAGGWSGWARRGRRADRTRGARRAGGPAFHRGGGPRRGTDPAVPARLPDRLPGGRPGRRGHPGPRRRRADAGGRSRRRRGDHRHHAAGQRGPADRGDGTGPAVSARDGPGGASPRRVREHAERVRRRVAAARQWNAGCQSRNAAAESRLLATAGEIAAAC